MIENKLYLKWITDFYNASSLELNHDLRNWIREVGPQLNTLANALNDIRNLDEDDTSSLLKAQLIAANALIDMNDR